MDRKKYPIDKSRFQHLYPFASHYVSTRGLNYHFVDEGEGELILCLHGEPTWSYLYRKMIPILSEDHRVLAMDFIGFGRSDKLTEMSEYSFKLHHDTLVSFIEELNFFIGVAHIVIKALLNKRQNRFIKHFSDRFIDNRFV